MARPKSQTIKAGGWLRRSARRVAAVVAALAVAFPLATGPVLADDWFRSLDGPARSGVDAPDTGSSLLAKRRILTYYGNPWSNQMGILGELTPAELVRQMKEQTKKYQAVSDKPVQGAIHLIATVAQAAPGDDGRYRARMPDSMIEEYANLAFENDLLLILDIQIGRSTVRDEIAAIEPYLHRPNVHLALDPEFAMKPGKRPGQVIGSLDAAQINEASRTLAEIAQKDGLPNRLLIVHQFTPDMIENKSAIRLDPEVDLVILMDGFGDQESKIEHYNQFVRDEKIAYGGIKLFFQQDTNLMTPAEVLALQPSPDVIVYQ